MKRGKEIQTSTKVMLQTKADNMTLAVASGLIDNEDHQTSDTELLSLRTWLLDFLAG